MTHKNFDASDLAALAAEACELWQEHLTACATDPNVNSELLRLMEPQRQLFANLFADYTAMMQNATHAAKADPVPAAGTNPAAPAARPAPAASPSDDGALRLAQFAHRVAVLEQHMADLERRLAGIEPGSGTAKPDA